MNKRRKVECDMTLLKENILEQQEHLHDVKMECFTEIHKMANKVKVLEKHLEIVFQINLKMGSLQVNIQVLDKWRSIEKNVPSILPVIKSYDIGFHTLATSECQELASKFEEKARQNLVGMMELYDKSIYNIQRCVQWTEINLEMNTQFLFPFSKSSKTNMKRSRYRFKQRNSYPKMIFKNF